VKSIISLLKHLGAATLCFSIGVASFCLFSMRRSESPRPILTYTSNKPLMQGSLSYVDSSRFYESLMANLQNSVSRNRPGYRFDSAFCTCPGIISDQQSYREGILWRSDEFVAEVYIAESRSRVAAKKWIEASSKEGAVRFLNAPNLEAIRAKNKTGIFIRLDRFVIQISGEASAVEDLAKELVRQLPAS